MLDFERKSPTAQRRREYALLDFDVRNPRGPERKRVAPRPASNRHNHHLVAPRNCECHIVRPLTAEPNAKKRETAPGRFSLSNDLKARNGQAHSAPGRFSNAPGRFSLFAHFRGSEPPGLPYYERRPEVHKGKHGKSRKRKESEKRPGADTEANREEGRNARNYRAVNHHVDCTFSVLSAH